jgi:hypothetical protein
VTVCEAARPLGRPDEECRRPGTQGCAHAEPLLRPHCRGHSLPAWNYRRNVFSFPTPPPTPPAPLHRDASVVTCNCRNRVSVYESNNRPRHIPTLGHGSVAWPIMHRYDPTIAKGPETDSMVLCVCSGNRALKKLYTEYLCKIVSILTFAEDAVVRLRRREDGG